MKLLTIMVASFIIGFITVALIQNFIPSNDWYLVVQFRSSNRTLMLAGPYSSKLECENNPTALQYFRAGERVSSTIKCINKLPDAKLPRKNET